MQDNGWNVGLFSVWLVWYSNIKSVKDWLVSLEIVLFVNVKKIELSAFVYKNKFKNPKRKRN